MHTYMYAEAGLYVRGNVASWDSYSAGVSVYFSPTHDIVIAGHLARLDRAAALGHWAITQDERLLTHIKERELHT
jgi:hypothetical protein